MSSDKFTVQAAVDGKLQLSDLRMDPATLAHQAVVAEEGGNPSAPSPSGSSARLHCAWRIHTSSMKKTGDVSFWTIRPP
jgi:hypothetical protein